MTGERAVRGVCGGGTVLRRSIIPSSMLVASILTVVPVAPLPAQRVVERNVVVSDTLPAARISLDSALRYLGTQAITLGSGTRAEQHFWVDAADRRVRRFYWLQFEGKPSGGRPYDYGRDSLVVHDGIPLRVAFRFYPPSGLSDPPGSDGERARQRVEAEGFTFGPDLARVRLVWLLGDPPLDELMVIYVEDLASHDLTVAELDADPERWRTFREGLLARALAGMRIDREPNDR